MVHLLVLDACCVLVPRSLEFLQAIQQAPRSPQLLLIITQGAFDRSRPHFDASASLWGLARPARLEMPRVTIKIIDVQLDMGSGAIASAVKEELQAPSTDLKVAYTTQGRCVPRLVSEPCHRSQIGSRNHISVTYMMPPWKLVSSHDIGHRLAVASMYL